MNQNYALIVGVRDYQHLGESYRVDGALADVRAHYRQCLGMGFSPERIRVLSSPRISLQDLGPEATEQAVGDADYAGLYKGLTWLIQRISGEEPAAGLFTFSGHGLDTRGVSLCPSDVTPSHDNLLHIAKLRAELALSGLDGASEKLTMLLDCCHAQVGLGEEARMQARLLAAQRGWDLPEIGVKQRVISASAHGGVSESSTFCGMKLGAFTWAITSALGQWQSVEEQGVDRLDVSYGKIVERVNTLLGALSFEQKAVLSGPKGVERWPFLHPGREEHQGDTSEAPTAERGRRQLDGGWYIIKATTNGTTQEIAQVFATGRSDTGITPPKIDQNNTESGCEYWYFDDSALARLTEDSSLTIALQNVPAICNSPAYGTKQRSRTHEYVTWTQASPISGPHQASFLFMKAGDPDIYLQLVTKTTADTTQTTAAGIGWFQSGSGESNINPEGMYSLVPSLPSAYTGVTWLI